MAQQAPVPGGAGQEAGGSARRNRSRPWRTAAKWVALGVVASFAVAYLVGRWPQIVDGFARMSPAHLVLGVLTCMVGLWCSSMSWRAVLSGLGSPLPVPAASRVYFLGQLGKYVPGSIWPIVAQAELSSEYGVPRTRAAVATLTQMLVSVVVGGITATIGLLVAAPGALTTYWWLLPVVLAGAASLAPAVFGRLLRLVGRVLRRPVHEVADGRGMLISAAWSAAMWLAFGVHLWLLLGGPGRGGASLLVTSTGAYALAWVVGFLVVVLPAGAGAREGALVLVLTPGVAEGDALAVALVSRVVMLVGDVALAGGAVLMARVHARRAGAPEDSASHPPQSRRRTTDQ